MHFRRKYSPTQDTRQAEVIGKGVTSGNRTVVNNC